MITISESAKTKIDELIVKDGLTKEHFLRVGVKGGGCSGIRYSMEFDHDVKDGDEVFEDRGIKIVCDKKSILYLWGTELDYSDGLNGRGFEWRNPNASRTCGCGESFSL